MDQEITRTSIDAIEHIKGIDEWTKLTDMDIEIRKIKPDFSLQSYGYSRLVDLVSSLGNIVEN